MAFVLGVLLFVVVIGILDRRLIPWPKPPSGSARSMSGPWSWPVPWKGWRC